jgi:hypothetical protein
MVRKSNLVPAVCLFNTRLEILFVIKENKERKHKLSFVNRLDLTSNNKTDEFIKSWLLKK